MHSIVDLFYFFKNIFIPLNKKSLNSSHRFSEKKYQILLPAFESTFNEDFIEFYETC
jgi:hypothetical protein